MRDSAMTSDKERLMGKQYSREYSSLEGKDCLVNTLQSVESAAAKPHSSEPAAAKMKETLFNNPQSSKSTASKVKDIATNTRHSRKSAELKENFMKLLKETTGIDTLSKWKYIKSDIETDPRFKAETSECRKKQWFKEYIKKLKQTRKGFITLLQNNSDMDVSSGWNHNKTKIESKRQYIAVPNDSLREHWFVDYSKHGCMECRHKVKLDTEMIKRNLPILQKGDHIQMPLKNPLLGTFLSHHAIVDEFKVDEGKVTDFCVIEIPDKGGFREKNLRIERNKCDVDLDQIKLIEYRKRKYDHTETYFRALKVGDHDLQRADPNRKSTNGSINTYESTTSTNVKPNNAQKPSYNVFRRNCEHFASACVNGQSRFSTDNVDQSTSLQSTKCWWIFFDIIIFLLQCSCFLTNFYIYAVYVKKDERYNHFPAWFMGFIDRLQCYHPERDEKGFKTDCDWKALGLFVGLFILIFVILLLHQYCCLIKKHKCVCEECLMARKILYCAKVLLFVIFEIINIKLERPLFNIIDWLNYHAGFTLFFFIIICAIEALVVTRAASILTRYFIRYISFPCRCSFPCCKRCITKCPIRCRKCTRWCSDRGCTCKFEEDAYKYVVRNITCHDVSLCLDSCFLCLTCCRGNGNKTGKLKNRRHTV